MPKYIDYHAKLPPMPPEALKQVKADMQAGKVNQFGMKGLNFFMGKGGQGYCLSEAPNADAVIKTHGAMGVTLEKHEVIEVTSLI